MRVAVQVTFKSDRKEPLGDLVRRVAAQFERSGLVPDVVAAFSDGPAGIRSTSAVDRALKKHPHLARFDRNDAPIQAPGIGSIRRLTNSDASQPFSMTDVLALADGVPRSLPFHAVKIHFGHAEFGQLPGLAPGLTPSTGINLGDAWWVNGRNRSLTALFAVEATVTAKKLPDPPSAVGAILAGLGKPKKTAQFAIPDATSETPAESTGGPSLPRTITPIASIVARYRSNLRALVERVGLPHDLPPANEARLANRGGSGPLKPTLVEAFATRGFDCRGESGTFTLRRRTATNHVIELDLDVGTWSRSLTFMFHVRGPGYNATLIPPITARDAAAQYPIGDTANWKRIVENMGAIVDELERTFVPEVEAAAGPAPEWFDPGR
jgi:hypothetical protein